MFRRRDVSELLQATGIEEEMPAEEMQEEQLADRVAEKQEEAPAAVAPFAQSAKVTEMASRPAASTSRKMTLADHFAEQARPVAQAFRKAPEAPVAKEVPVAKEFVREPLAAREPVLARPNLERQMQPEPRAEARSPLMTSNALSVFASAAASPVVEEEKSNKRVLTVGPETCLKGEISRCDRVVIEGQVHAEMKEVDSLEIASGGAFVGSAVVGNAEISGHFEGDLKVEGRLVVHEQGSVHGKLVYGEIQVMRGGKIVGQVSLAGDASDEQPEASATKETKKERASKLANA